MCDNERLAEDKPSPAFDAFVSYRWRDAHHVELVAKRLQAQGIRVFLDRWYLELGKPWPQALEEVLSDCRSAIVFVGRDGPGRWQQREQYLALDRQMRDERFPVIPVLLPGSDPPLGFLKLNTWVDLRLGIDEPAQLAILAATIRGAPPDSETQERIDEVLAEVCPYRGLKAFREEDAEFFCGRERDIARLSHFVTRQPFITVAGASGCGKSSLVRAGLIPRLRNPLAEQVWDIATMFPRERPLHSLAATLLPFLEPERTWTETDRLIEVNKLSEAFLNFKISLRDVIDRVLDKLNGTDRFMLVVDQWEELYTLCNENKQRNCFLEHILEATSSGPLTVVSTLRGDFFGYALSNRELAERMQDAVLNLGPMTHEELERSIMVPAQKVHLEFEAGLVDRILDDVGSEPGNLPLLEFVLTELWKQRRGRVLHHEAYESMNGVRGAIASRAEAVFETLSKQERETAHRIIIQMVHPGEGTEDTRRRAHLATDDPAIKSVITRLVDGRLLVSERDDTTCQETFEVTHEALIRNWQRLRDWLKSDREFLRTKERLEVVAIEWEKGGKREDRLLSAGQPLAEGQQLLRERRRELDKVLIEFIQASQHHQRRHTWLHRAGVSVTALVVLGVVIVGNGWWLRIQGLTYYDQYARTLAKIGYYIEPEMIEIPSGSFFMSSPENIATGAITDTKRAITIPKLFLIGKYEVTFAEYDVFALATRQPLPDDLGSGRGRFPVVNISWESAVAYTKWLSAQTGKSYRLPSEAEWEYAARAGSTGSYWWCDKAKPNCDVKEGAANCEGCGSQWDGQQAAPAGSFEPNPFGLYDTAGNVWEYVRDCWHGSYESAPTDSFSWEDGDCGHRVARGGSWFDSPEFVESSERHLIYATMPGVNYGFRVAQDVQ